MPDFYLNTVSAAGIGIFAYRDATPPVPESATLLLFGLGLAGMSFLKRGRKKDTA